MEEPPAEDAAADDHEPVPPLGFVVDPHRRATGCDRQAPQTLRASAAQSRRHARFSNKPIAFPLHCAALSELRFEDSCDEFPGRRGSDFVMPVASDPTMDSARAGPFESDGGR